MAEAQIVSPKPDRTIIVSVTSTADIDLMPPIKINIPEIVSLRIAILLVMDCVMGSLKRGLRAALIAVGVGK
jgi:hypothetical protein